MLPFISLINSSILTSLFSWGKYLSRNASINSSHSKGLDSNGTLSFHLVNNTRETSFNWYEDYSAFSFKVTPIECTIFYTSSKKACRSSHALELKKIGGFNFTKSLDLEVIVLSIAFTLCLMSRFSWVVIAQTRVRRTSLVSPLAIIGGTTGTSLPHTSLPPFTIGELITMRTLNTLRNFHTLWHLSTSWRNSHIHIILLNPTSWCPPRIHLRTNISKTIRKEQW